MLLGALTDTHCVEMRLTISLIMKSVYFSIKCTENKHSIGIYFGRQFKLFKELLI